MLFKSKQFLNLAISGHKMIQNIDSSTESMVCIVSKTALKQIMRRVLHRLIVELPESRWHLTAEQPNTDEWRLSRPPPTFSSQKQPNYYAKINRWGLQKGKSVRGGEINGKTIMNIFPVFCITRFWWPMVLLQHRMYVVGTLDLRYLNTCVRPCPLLKLKR
jgi:hypothetical protein